MTVSPTTRNSWQLTSKTADLRRPALVDTAATFVAEPQAVTVDLARTATIVVDMQNDFCHPDGWLAGIGVDVTGARAPIPILEKLLPSLRQAGVPILWVNWGNRPDQANLPPGVRHVYDTAGTGGGIGSTSSPAGSPVLQAGAWASDVVDELPADPADILVDKYRMSGFEDTPLDSILPSLRVDSLLFAGVNADQCVLATLMDAANLGYDVVMIEDAVGTTSPQFCMDATVYNVRQCFGFTTTSAAILPALP
jgi:ureidoacrylate peracid hydrolase